MHIQGQYPVLPLAKQHSCNTASGVLHSMASLFNGSPLTDKRETKALSRLSKLCLFDSADTPREVSDESWMLWKSAVDALGESTPFSASLSDRIDRSRLA
jgi:hypothetical protein